MGLFLRSKKELTPVEIGSLPRVWGGNKNPGNNTPYENRRFQENVLFPGGHFWNIPPRKMVGGEFRHRALFLML